MGSERRAASKRGKGRGPPPPSQEQLGILVQELLNDENYDKYIERIQSQKGVSPQFYCSLSDIESMSLGFHEMLAFQKLGKFVGLKDGYDESHKRLFIVLNKCKMV